MDGATFLEIPGYNTVVLPSQIEERLQYIGDLIEDGSATSEDFAAFIILGQFKQQCLDANSDWNSDYPIVNSKYFTEYAISGLEDSGELPRDLPWYIVVDHEKTAFNLRQDWNVVHCGSDAFYVRNA